MKKVIMTFGFVAMLGIASMAQQRDQTFEWVGGISRCRRASGHNPVNHGVPSSGYHRLLLSHVSN